MTGFGKHLKSLSWRIWWKHSQEDWVRKILSNCSALIRIGWHHESVTSWCWHGVKIFYCNEMLGFSDLFMTTEAFGFIQKWYLVWTAVKHHVRMSFPRRCGDRSRGELQFGTKTALLSCTGLCPQKQHPNYGWGDSFYRHGHGKTTSTSTETIYFP